MFRPMRRFRQQLTDEEAMRVLKEGHLGVLSVQGDDGYPYGVPLDYVCDDSGRIYFHCAGEGHKIDAIRRDDKVSFCVMDQGTVDEGDFARRVNCVIVFGRIRMLQDREQIKQKAMELAMHIFPEQKAFYQKDLQTSGNRVQVLELTPEHITGKRVHEQ